MAPLRRRLLPLVLALPGLGRAARTAPGPRRLVWWTMQLAPFHTDYVQRLIAGFEARHPGVRVDWVDVPWSEMERKVLASLAAGSAPDVVNLNPQFSARLAELGALRDPRPFLDGSEVDAFVPAAWAANQLAGVPFALPWYLSTTVTLYRQDLLDQARASPPLDFQSLGQVARVLRERVGTYAWFPAMDGSAPLEAMVAMGGRLLTPDGCRPAFDNAQGVAAFAWHRDLFERRCIPPAVLTEGHRGAVAHYLSGQLALVSTGMQFMTHLATGSPTLFRRTGVSPQVTSGSSRPNIAAMNLAVLATCSQPELAFRLAQWVTDATHQLELVKRVPLLPSTRASYDDPLFASRPGPGLLDQARAMSVRQVMAGEVQVPPLRRYHKLRTSFVRSLQSAMTGRSSPQAAIDEASRAWVPLLACRT